MIYVKEHLAEVRKELENAYRELGGHAHMPSGVSGRRQVRAKQMLRDALQSLSEAEKALSEKSPDRFNKVLARAESIGSFEAPYSRIELGEGEKNIVIALAGEPLSESVLLDRLFNVDVEQFRKLIEVLRAKVIVSQHLTDKGQFQLTIRGRNVVASLMIGRSEGYRPPEV